MQSTKVASSSCRELPASRSPHPLLELQFELRSRHFGVLSLLSLLSPLLPPSRAVLLVGSHDVGQYLCQVGRIQQLRCVCRAVPIFSRYDAASHRWCVVVDDAAATFVVGIKTQVLETYCNSPNVCF
eukprot:TRINITY_DN5789_c0_g1_i1.p1 TRINITY_DN5789_c0_g1~~TRINITY_DN5789_c0_g1_i1.p1  ORF type:complete len:127 (+),score=2.98 TRINITY_DN5789_c0_g1_i1:188-568(+)